MHYPFEGLRDFYLEKSAAGFDAYSGWALARIWKSERFSRAMIMLLHRFPTSGECKQKAQEAELEYLYQSEAAQTVLAENYLGLPY